MEKKVQYRPKAAETVRMSKTLSMILRHQAVKMGLEITADGYVKIAELFKLDIMQKFSPTIEKLQDVVSDNDKKRFEISADGLSIRAVQGHTIKVWTNETIRMRRR